VIGEWLELAQPSGGRQKSARAGGVEDEAQAARLRFRIRLEVMFLGGEFAQQLLQRGEVVETGGAAFDG